MAWSVLWMFTTICQIAPPRKIWGDWVTSCQISVSLSFQTVSLTLHNPIFTQRFFISILKFTLIFTHNFAILIDKRRWRLCQ